MLEVVPTKSFKRDLKKYQHKKDVVKELYDVISILAKREPLDPKKKDHNLVEIMLIIENAMSKMTFF